MDPSAQRICLQHFSLQLLWAVTATQPMPLRYDSRTTGLLTLIVANDAIMITLLVAQTKVKALRDKI